MESRKKAERKFACRGGSAGPGESERKKCGARRDVKFANTCQTLLLKCCTARSFEDFCSLKTPKPLSK